MARLLLFAAALLFSTGGVAIKGNALTAWQVASYRSLVAAVVLTLAFPHARRNWSMRHVLVGFAYAGTLISFVAANKLTTAANAIFLQSTAPGYLVVLSPLLLKEKLRKSDFWLLLAVGFGMTLFFVAAEPARLTAPDPVTGNLVALFSGVAWALTVLGLRWLHEGGMSIVVLGNWMTFFIALPLALPVPAFNMGDVASLLYLGIFQVGLAYVCLTKALARIPAFQAATLLLVEPAMNPVWTWLVLGERPASLAVAGGAVILVSTLVNTWRSRAAT